MKYAIYARVSPKGSGFENETSLEMQVNFCREYVKLQRGEIVDIQQDEFFSGKDMKRPGFQKLMNDLKTGKAEWECLCVYKLSRLTRSSKDGAQIFEDLRMWNKGFISVTEPNFDFSTPMGRAMLSIFQAFNQFEREQTAENTRNKMISIAQQGKWPVGITPFGYCRSAKHDNTLKIVPLEAEIVKSIFQMYADGSEVIRICRKYNKTAQWIYHMLENPVYIGQIRYDGKIYPGKHQPIITQELWNQIRDKRTILKPDGDKTFLTRPKKYKYPYLLPGILRCSCGRYMTPASAKSGAYHYYRCTDNIRCKNRVSAPEIEEKIINMLPLFELDEEFIRGYRDCIQQMQEKEKGNMQKDRMSILSALGVAKKEHKRLWDYMIDVRPSDPAVINARLAELDRQIKEFEARLDFLSQQIKNFSSSKATFLLKFIDELYHINDFLQKFPENADLRRQFLTATLETITVDKYGNFEFKLRGFRGTSNGKSGCLTQTVTFRFFVDFFKKKVRYMLSYSENGKVCNEFQKTKTYKRSA